MLQIEAVKIVINTNNGLFGRTIQFKKGLNIIRANNTSGKSSLFGAIIYGLGFEELLGGRNEKALQSVFKSIVKEVTSENGILDNIVIQSEILLQINNGVKSITTKRFVVNSSVKPQAIEVFMGGIIINPDLQVDREPMYLHDKGSASNEEIGFHKYLEKFINAKLPEIIGQDGRRVKLYLPLISCAHFIEQKAGWSDFYANIPYYGIRDSSTKVFEYILNFDVFEIAAKRQELQNLLRDNEEKWKLASEKIKSIISRAGGEIIGLPELPEVLSKDIKPYLKFYRGEDTYMLDELIAKSRKNIDEVYAELNTTINSNLEVIEENIKKLKIQTDNYEVLYESLASEISQDRERLRQYLQQSESVLEDLKKNKDAEKLQRLGLTSNLKLSFELCPTCNQSIQDNLLSGILNVIPMRIDENIEYLLAQKKMIDAFINNIRETVLEKETKLDSIERAIQTNRRKVRLLRRDLIADDRLPSEELIERKIVLERELSFLYKVREEFGLGLEDIYLISAEFEAIKARESTASKSYHSHNDLNKLIYFENTFKELLEKFDYTSKPVSTIKISTEKYTPVYELSLENGMSKQIDIRFESSASDFIRSEWAYYTSLLKASSNNNGNHFLTLIFDEPQQQSASTLSFKLFLEELEKFENEQVIILGSFQNSDEDFKYSTEGLINANIIDFAAHDELVIKKQS